MNKKEDKNRGKVGLEAKESEKYINEYCVV